jgi:alpha-L-fucosidase
MKHASISRWAASAAALISLTAPAIAQEPQAGARPIVAPEEIAAGPFQPNDPSLAEYQCPDWFRDAKFGIWSHWGPQAVPREGDWYARGMYENTQIDRKTGKAGGQNRYNKYHLEHYGHPSKFGFKDIIPLWKAERLDPDQLMALYKKTGARYFVSMGTHHDNFFLWDSRIHRWNSVKMGPQKDIVGIYQQAARKQGLKFGVSEHLGASFTWFRTAHGADAAGPMKGVPYDGNDPANQDLYHKPRAAGDNGWLTNNPADQRRWFECIKELVDLYQPDLVYSDSPMPFGDVGRSLVAHLYNSSAARNGGATEAVYTCKEDAKGKWVRDIERGVADAIRPEPWQTDTSIGDWYYRRGQKYMTSGEVIRMLADIVSKNGNLLLNVVQTPEGDLEKDVLDILDGIGRWVEINAGGIYGSRPWKTYGEGPSTSQDQEKGRFGGLKDVPTKPFTAEDFRFTASQDGRTLFAYCFAVPEKEFRIVSLGKDSKLNDQEIESVGILGSQEKIVWNQQTDALVVAKPSRIPNKEAVGIRITFKQ